MWNKKMIAIVSLILICQVSHAQKNVKQLFKDFSGVENSNVVNVGNITMSLAGLFSDTMGVDGIEIFGLDNCNEDIKSNFAKAVRELKDAKYETMVSHNENDSRMKVLVKMEQDMIKELVVLTSGKNNALIRIKGNIKPEDIDRVVNQHGKK